MESVDFSVNESKCMVSYDRSSSELNGLKSSNFDFRFETNPDGQEFGVLEITKDGNVVRRTESQPFPPGTFEKRSVDTNKVNYNVTLKKLDKNAKIGTYFF